MGDGRPERRRQYRGEAGVGRIESAGDDGVVRGRVGSGGDDQILMEAGEIVKVVALVMPAPVDVGRDLEGRADADATEPCDQIAVMIRRG